MTNDIRAVVFDWAGTMVDFGSRAPIGAFAQAFAERGVDLHEHEILADMGRAKREHIVRLLERPEVAERWRMCTGSRWTSLDVDQLMIRLEPLMRSSIEMHGQLIPGACESVEALRSAGAKIGSTTGYTQAMMPPLIRAAADQGYAPDVVLCSDDAPLGRPAPFLIWKALLSLERWPIRQCVVVDDTCTGVEAGRAAGAWTVGCAISGALVGLTQSDWEALDGGEMSRRFYASRAALEASGADFVIETVAQLPAAIAEIRNRLLDGGMPGLHPASPVATDKS